MSLYLKDIIIFLGILINGVFSIAQTPMSHHFNIDEDLPFSKIYNIDKDKNGYLWIATDKGIFRYNGIQFDNFLLRNQKSTHVSNIQEDEKGRIWHYSFGGEILYIENDSIQLLKDITTQVNRFPYYVFNSGKFHFNSKKDYLFNFNTQTFEWDSIPVENSLKEEYLPFYSYENLTFYLYHNHKIFVSQNNKIRQIDINQKKYFEKLSPIRIRDELYFLLEKDGKSYVYLYDNSEFIKINDFLSPLENTSLIHIYYHDNLVYFSTRNGLMIYDIQNNKFKETLFKDEYITASLIDNEKNLWVSTLNNGLFKIPNLELYHLEIDKNIRKLYQLENDGQNLYFSTSEGQLFQFNPLNKRTQLLYQNKNKSAVRLFKSNIYNKNLIFFTDRLTSHYDINKNEIYTYTKGLPTSVKDLNITRNGLIFSRNILMALEIKDSLRVHQLHQKWKESKEIDYINFIAKNKKTYKAPLIRFRKDDALIRANHYDIFSDTYWLACNDGVFYYKNGKEKQLFNNNQSVFFNKIVQTSDSLIWGASSNGLFIIKNKKIIKVIGENDGLISNNINSLYTYKNDIYLITSKGLQRYNYQNNTFHLYDLSDGFPSNDIKDISIMDNQIYVMTKKGIVYFSTELKDKIETLPIAVIHNIQINEEQTGIQNQYELAHDKNNISIELNSISLRSGDLIIYEYRMYQNDKITKWLSIPSGKQKLFFNNLNHGIYHFEFRVRNTDGVYSEIKKITFCIHKSFFESIYFYLLLILTAFGLAYFIFKRRAKVKYTQIQLEKSIKTAEIKAIKAQMNPHFIFNSLNSIQELIFQKDFETVNEYLGKFSDLVRFVLNSSEKLFIPFHKELEMLNLYLDLEKLRFEDKFNIHFDVNIPLDQQNQLKIPAMLIQPYIENAIKHGLLHKEGSKNLIINFSIQNERLFCIIEDNGIGRKKANELSWKNKHGGFGNKANNKKIDLINQLIDEKIYLKIDDLYHQEMATGTKVTLDFPIYFNYNNENK